MASSPRCRRRRRRPASRSTRSSPPTRSCSTRRPTIATSPTSARRWRRPGATTRTNSRRRVRALMKLRLNVAAPAPDDAHKRARLTQLEAQLEARYGEGKYCPQGPASCRNLDQLSDTLARSRNYDELTEAWKGWHGVGAGMRADYREFVALANEGARELGFKDLGV